MKKPILIIVALVAIAALYVGRMDIPQREGSLKAASLASEVSILRGDDGVPYIYAQSLDDALVAQGFLHAQDRLFQMELFKYLAHGRLAEFIGERGLSMDRIVRLVDVTGFTRAQEKKLSREERNYLTRYLSGVNDYIATREDEFPLMLGVMGHEVQPWTLEDVLAVQYFRIWSSSVNWKQELLTLRLYNQLGTERAASLAPLVINQDDPNTDPRNQADDQLASQQADDGQNPVLLSYDDSLFSDYNARSAMGSDAWASDGAHSSGGAPILSSDPHLDARQLPGFWYPMGLITPELRAVGGSTPGGPGLGVGRSNWIAWGATNGYSDMVDLYIETADPANEDNFLEGDRSLPFIIRTEELRIKDKEAPTGYRSQTMVIRETTRGAIISDHGMEVAPGKMISLRWSVPEYAGPDSGNRELLIAESVEDALVAIGKTTTPLNYIVADVDGNVARMASGVVPIRSRGDGLAPLEPTAEDNWLGRIPPRQMPLQHNPEKGWVGSSNHRVTGSDYPYPYSTHFAGSWRYGRLMELMDRDVLSAEDHWAANMDMKNLLAQRVRPAMIAVFESEPGLQPLASLLQEWNLLDEKEQAAPLIFQSAFRHLANETFVDDMGEELLSDYLKETYYWQELFLYHYEHGSHWFDDSRTESVETRDDMILRAGLLTLEELSGDWGDDPKAWKWGDAHTIQFSHPFIPGERAARWIGGGVHPYSGSGETLYRAVYFFNEEGYETRINDSMRIIIDLADNDKVIAHYPGGVSERLFDSWNKNFLDAYLTGEKRYWWFSDEAIAANTDTEMRLVP